MGCRRGTAETTNRCVYHLPLEGKCDPLAIPPSPSFSRSGRPRDARGRSVRGAILAGWEIGPARSGRSLCPPRRVWLHVGGGLGGGGGPPPPPHRQAAPYPMTRRQLRPFGGAPSSSPPCASQSAILWASSRTGTSCLSHLGSAHSSSVRVTFDSAPLDNSSHACHNVPTIQYGQATRGCASATRRIGKPVRSRHGVATVTGEPTASIPLAEADG